MSRGRNLVALPEITVRNLQRTVPVDVAALQEFAQQALQSCSRIPRNGPTQLKRLREIFVLLISDRRMARLHRQFLKEAGSTDVLTFEHGEIFLSAERARDHARRFASSLGQEVRLYIVHGLLHLHGFDDRNEVEAQRMERMQRQILAAALKRQLKRRWPRRAPGATLFELEAAYVSISSMSWQPRRGSAEVAQSERSEGEISISNQNANPATVEAPVIEQETRSEEDLDLPWQVVVHNDPVNLMSYVTMVFQRVFGYPREKAERHMLEVHHKGRSILWSGMRERAELYVQQLHGYLLLATLEKIG